MILLLTVVIIPMLLFAPILLIENVVTSLTRMFYAENAS